MGENIGRKFAQSGHPVWRGAFTGTPASAIVTGWKKTFLQNLLRKKMGAYS
jgi:hypothetical protein